MGLLEIRHLTKRFNGIPAVYDVNFSLAPGETIGYIGPNGAGKSTTVKMLIGLVQPSEGQILYNARSIREDLLGFQRILGYVPEEPNLYSFLSGREYLQLCGRLRGIARKVLEHKISELLHLFSLWDDRECQLCSYSKGMRQKILLSAALMHNPDILILDEPLSGLDVNTMLAVRDLLQRLTALGKTILYSSHELDVMEKVCSRVLILRKGTVVADGAIGYLRDSVNQPSLERIFTHFTAEESNQNFADHLIEVMQA